VHPRIPDQRQFVKPYRAKECSHLVSAAESVLSLSAG
jgi:hypothetical protein